MPVTGEIKPGRGMALRERRSQDAEEKDPEENSETRSSSTNREGCNPEHCVLLEKAERMGQKLSPRVQ